MELDALGGAIIHVRAIDREQCVAAVVGQARGAEAADDGDVGPGQLDAVGAVEIQVAFGGVFGLGQTAQELPRSNLMPLSG